MRLTYGCWAERLRGRVEEDVKRLLRMRRPRGARAADEVMDDGVEPAEQLLPLRLREPPGGDGRVETRGDRVVDRFLEPLHRFALLLGELGERLARHQPGEQLLPREPEIPGGGLEGLVNGVAGPGAEGPVAERTVPERRRGFPTARLRRFAERLPEIVDGDPEPAGHVSEERLALGPRRIRRRTVHRQGSAPARGDDHGGSCADDPLARHPHSRSEAQNR